MLGMRAVGDMGCLIYGMLVMRDDGNVEYC